MVNREKLFGAGQHEPLLITRRSLVQIQLPQPFNKKAFGKIPKAFLHKKIGQLGIDFKEEMMFNIIKSFSYFQLFIFIEANASIFLIFNNLNKNFNQFLL